MKLTFLFLGIQALILLMGYPTYCYAENVNHDKGGQKQSTSKHIHVHDDKKSTDTPEIGLTEKLGQYVPLDLTFYKENGKTVELDELINKPTVVALIFFSCRGSCPLLLGGLASALGKLQLDPGKDYFSMAISFDHEDTPKIASQAKPNYIAAIGKPYPEESWHFLTGNMENINKFTNAVGFKFKKEKGGFTHTVGLIVLSPKGKIVRYLYGTSFLPFDLNMALTEASEEREGLSVKKVLLYCFSYDPKEKKYVFNIMKVVGTATIAFVVFLFIYLTVSARRARKKAN